MLAVAGAGRSMGSRELARLLDLEPTRTNRLLRTLAELGLTHQDAARKYLPGAGMHVLSAMSLFGSQLVRRSLWTLQTLHDLGGVVAMGVLWRDQVAYLYHAEPGMEASQALGRVGLYPATRSSMGIMLLAHQPKRLIADLYREREIPGFVNLTSLRATLALARQQGWAKVKSDEGGVSLAVPIAAPNQPPCSAIAVSGHFAARQLRKILQTIQAAQARIQKEAFNNAKG